MCGIAVTIELPSNVGVKPNAHELTKVMLHRLSQRGPDDSTILCIPEDHATRAKGPTVVLGHTRLSIVGGATAKHPFRWSIGKKQLFLIHNGEIYNHHDLKEKLVLEEHCKASDFSTECDSEVLLACCAYRGVEWTLAHAKGMFAFVLVECSQTRGGVPFENVDRVIVARDTLGIKPLCYAIDSTMKRVIFASQVAAFPHVCGLDKKYDIQIKDVLPGTYIKFTFQRDNNAPWNIKQVTRMYENNDLGPRPWWPTEENHNSSTRNSVLSIDCLDTFRMKLIDAIRSHLPPKESCPAAILLSGGLNSSLVAAIAARHLYPGSLCTFNISFRDKSNKAALPELDCYYAKLVDEHVPNLDHREVLFSFDDGKAVLAEVIKCLETYDAVCVRAGVPLYLLSKYIASLGFQVVLCGEGADESMAGYRLFEDFLPSQRLSFLKELNRRLVTIDTSELHRVDRCTSAHGLEACVPFLDLAFVQEVMKFCPSEKMSHSSLGRIQKYILRKAFDVDNNNWLPDSVLYREKEQFADGIGRGWVQAIQKYAIKSEGISDGECAEKALYKRLFTKDATKQHLDNEIRDNLVQERQERRRQDNQGNHHEKGVRTGKAQPTRWYSVSYDSDLQQINVTKKDAYVFLHSVLGWNSKEIHSFSPSLASLNHLISSMLEKVPFHNLTLLVRERTPPTMEEIKQDMMSGLGGPCSVVNTFFAALLVALGFGPSVYLLSCNIHDQNDCHVAILVQIKGLRYFVDVANAKPYREAVHLGDSSIKTALNGTFEWHLEYNVTSGLMELKHFTQVALSFHPSSTVPFSSFHAMIIKSRTNKKFGPFLTGLRFCLYPSSVSSIMAVRDICIYEGKSMYNRRYVTKRCDIETFATQNHAFSRIEGFSSMLKKALDVLDEENPDWFDNAVMEKNQRKMM